VNAERNLHAYLIQYYLEAYLFHIYKYPHPHFVMYSNIIMILPLV